MFTSLKQDHWESLQDHTQQLFKIKLFGQPLKALAQALSIQDKCPLSRKQ